MNKYQEAFKRLQIYNLAEETECDLLLPDYSYDDIINDLRTIKELVDKEIPMKPVKSSYGDYLCGKCNNLVWESFTPDRHERCNDKECGQVVDWSDENE